MSDCPKVRCVECLHADMRASKTWARFGCCTCRSENKSWHYLPLNFPRECARFAPAPADAVEKRRAWLILNVK